MKDKSSRLLNIGALAIFFASCTIREYSTPHIVGGVFTEPNTPIYNATVSLDADGIPFCTGALFDKRTVITAAHCIKGAPQGKNLSIGFGSARTSRKTSLSFERLTQTTAHPQWDSRDFASNTIDPLPKSPKNDIAIIVLSQDAPDWTNPIPLKMIGEVKPGEKILLVGFGQTRNTDAGGFNSTIEFRGEMRHVDGLIDTINKDGFEFVVKPTVENPLGSSCHGDSGGPLYYYDSNGTFTLLGVTSRGYSKEEDCAGRSVYTDARMFESWIIRERDAILKKIGPSSDEWQHRHIGTPDGTKIVIDYRLSSSGLQKIANEIWVNITNPTFSETENITVEMNSYVNTSLRATGKAQYAQNNRYTLRLNQLENQVVCTPYSRWGVQQSLSIRINNRIILSNEDNRNEFQFKFCES